MPDAVETWDCSGTDTEHPTRTMQEGEACAFCGAYTGTKRSRADQVKNLQDELAALKTQFAAILAAQKGSTVAPAEMVAGAAKAGATP